jgi:hypothetical protein
LDDATFKIASRYIKPLAGEVREVRMCKSAVHRKFPNVAAALDRLSRPRLHTPTIDAQKTLREAQEILDAYGTKPVYDEDGTAGAGGDASATPTLSDGARKAVAFVPVMNEAVLARAQRIAFLLS